eukprot:COSAG04_NODE_217_length_19889_cov_59.963221_3_plen_135_part_00
MHEWAHAELARLREAYPHRFGWAVCEHLFDVAQETRLAAGAIWTSTMSETECYYASIDFGRRVDEDMRDVAVVNVEIARIVARNAAARSDDFMDAADECDNTIEMWRLSTYGRHILGLPEGWRMIQVLQIFVHQ